MNIAAGAGGMRYDQACQLIEQWLRHDMVLQINAGAGHTHYTINIVGG